MMLPLQRLTQQTAQVLAEAPTGTLPMVNGPCSRRNSNEGRPADSMERRCVHHGTKGVRLPRGF